ncbi:hypothetical protein KKF05_01625 [Patescibacteria group bacterium]|nr:hypothetical protein [Patescibacteria group bacterium]MBU1029548.1 hypothetical protein [Patescibacteria group bacterium]MBU1915546.1 hypothetical protein [Patescibacteria group bacterium]
MVKMYRVWCAGHIVESPYPGRFAGIKTVKIFGRLDCWSGRRAFLKNRVFFHFWEDAIAADYRPCKHCRPEPFTRADCDHLPFGLAGPSALKTETDSLGAKISKRCLCGQIIS